VKKAELPTESSEFSIPYSLFSIENAVLSPLRLASWREARMTPDFAQTEGLPRKNTGRQDATKEIQPRISRMTRIRRDGFSIREIREIRGQKTTS